MQNLKRKETKEAKLRQGWERISQYWGLIVQWSSTIQTFILFQYNKIVIRSWLTLQSDNSFSVLNFIWSFIESVMRPRCSCRNIIHSSLILANFTLWTKHTFNSIPYYLNDFFFKDTLSLEVVIFTSYSVEPATESDSATE